MIRVIILGLLGIGISFSPVANACLGSGHEKAQRAFDLAEKRALNAKNEHMACTQSPRAQRTHCAGKLRALKEAEEKLAAAKEELKNHPATRCR